MRLFEPRTTGLFATRSQMYESVPGRGGRLTATALRLETRGDIPQRRQAEASANARFDGRKHCPASDEDWFRRGIVLATQGALGSLA